MNKESQKYFSNKKINKLCLDSARQNSSKYHIKDSSSKKKGQQLKSPEGKKEWTRSVLHLSHEIEFLNPSFSVPRQTATFCISGPHVCN